YDNTICATFTLTNYQALTTSLRTLTTEYQVGVPTYQRGAGVSLPGAWGCPPILSFSPTKGFRALPAGGLGVSPNTLLVRSQRPKPDKTRQNPTLFTKSVVAMRGQRHLCAYIHPKS